MTSHCLIMNQVNCFCYSCLNWVEAWCTKFRQNFTRPDHSLLLNVHHIYTTQKDIRYPSWNKQFAPARKPSFKRTPIFQPSTFRCKFAVRFRGGIPVEGVTQFKISFQRTPEDLNDLQARGSTFVPCWYSLMLMVMRMMMTMMLMMMMMMTTGNEPITRKQRWARESHLGRMWQPIVYNPVC